MQQYATKNLNKNLNNTYIKSRVLFVFNERHYAVPTLHIVGDLGDLCSPVCIASTWLGCWTHKLSTLGEGRKCGNIILQPCRFLEIGQAKIFDPLFWFINIG